MKRAADERERTVNLWRRHLALHESSAELCRCEAQPGRFRKGQRIAGCGNSRCYLCHREKLLKQPTPQQRRSNCVLREWLGAP